MERPDIEGIKVYFLNGRNRIPQFKREIVPQSAINMGVQICDYTLALEARLALLEAVVEVSQRAVTAQLKKGGNMNRETIVKNLEMLREVYKGFHLDLTAEEFVWISKLEARWATKLEEYDKIDAEWGLASAEWWIAHTEAKEAIHRLRRLPRHPIPDGKMVSLEEVKKWLTASGYIGCSCALDRHFGKD